MMVLTLPLVCQEVRCERGQSLDDLISFRIQRTWQLFNDGDRKCKHFQLYDLVATLPFSTKVSKDRRAEHRLGFQ